MSLEDAFAHRNRNFPNGGLSPSNFASLYRATPVLMEDGTTLDVDVHKYRLNRAATGTINTNHRIRDATADAERSLVGPLIRRWCHANGAIGERVRTLLWTERKLNQVFYGKGGPRDIAFMLYLLKEIGRIDRLYPNHTTAAAYQAYVDTYIGVDCSGLVGNYFINTGHLTDTNRNCQIPIRSYGQLTRRVDFLPERPRGFLLIWKDFGHIALINGWARKDADLQVVESGASMHGIRDTVYRIDPDFPDLSRSPSRRHWVVRRAAANNSRQEVYIVPPM